MGIGKSWQTTLAFRRFREKLHDLSRVYWTHELGAEAVKKHLDGVDRTEFTVDVIGCSFDRRMHPQKVSETEGWMPKYLERVRLHGLIITSAILESYIKDITFDHLASIGYLKTPKNKNELLKLNDLGEALGSPILSRSSIPEPLKFAEKLFELDYGANRTIWNKAYKLRCVAAHNGGMVMPKTQRQIPDLSIPEFNMIGISWDELRKAMNAADNIVSMTDYKVSNYSIWIIEAEQLLRILNMKGRLPERKKIWTVLHDEFGFNVKRKDKLRLERMFY